MANDQLLRRLPLVVALEELPSGGDLANLPLKLHKDVDHSNVAGIAGRLDPGADNIQAAIDSLPSTGGVVLLDPGTFTITTPLLVTNPNVRIDGAGPATILNITAGVGAFQVSGTRFNLSNVKIDLNSAGGSVVAVDITAGADSVVADVIFENVQGANTSYVKWASTQTHVIRCSGAITAGTVTEGFSATSAATSAIVSGCHAPATATGFRNLATDGVMENCSALLVTAGGILVEGDRQKVTNCNVTKAAVTGSGITVIGNDNTVSECNVTLFSFCLDIQGNNCTLDGCKTSGGSIGAEITGTFCNASGCQIIAATTGFRPQSAAHFCTITGGTITLPSGGTISRGIDIRASNNGTIVTGVHVDGTGNTSGTSIGIALGGTRSQSVGCRIANLLGRGIQSAGDFDAVTGCTVESTGTEGIRVTGDHVTVTGCTVRASGRDGILLTGANDCTVTGNISEGNTDFGISEEGASNFNTFGGNSLRGNTGGTISMIGASSINLDNERDLEVGTGTTASPNVLIAAESGKIITNEAVTEENFNTLPAAADGLEFTFYCHDTDGIRATAASGDTIRIAAGESASAGFIRSIVVGDSITLKAINGTEWVAIALGGNNWTIDV